jgi:hypothetical protein
VAVSKEQEASEEHDFYYERLREHCRTPQASEKERKNKERRFLSRFLRSDLSIFKLVIGGLNML